VFLGPCLLLNSSAVKFEVLTTVTTNRTIFWDVTQWSPVEAHWYLKEHWWISIRLQGIISQKIIFCCFYYALLQSNLWTSNSKILIAHLLSLTFITMWFERAVVPQSWWWWFFQQFNTKSSQPFEPVVFWNSSCCCPCPLKVCWWDM
jgi:hypothetical protein